MDYNDIERLLERYWRCETSVEEEARLRDFFTREVGGIVPYLRDIGVTEKSLSRLRARFLDAD